VTQNLGPFHNRKDEWRLYQPLVGSSMLELGNKINGSEVYKDFFESIGYNHTSIDMNGLDGALEIDLSKPVDLGQFDMISNIGTTEHVGERNNWDGQQQCWKNILNAMRVGSVLVSVTPAPGHWSHHGIWYPGLEFFENLAKDNGLEVERLYTETPEWANGKLRDLNFARLRRIEDRPAAVSRDGMSRNFRTGSA